MRKDIDERKDEIIGWLRAGTTQAEVARILKCKADTLRPRLKQWGVSHLKNPAGKGKVKKNSWVKADVYFKKDSPIISSHNLKLKLFRDGYKEKKCERCGIIEWQGELAPLELDHINGDHYDNSLVNLRILCPNCHALTPTHSGRNKNKTHGDMLELVDRHGLDPCVARRQGSNPCIPTKNKCIDCSTDIGPKAKRCKSCTGKKQKTKIKWPDANILLKEVKETSYLAVARRLSVSDNAIRKRIKQFS